MAYKITSKKDMKSTNLWDAEAEALIALLAKKLESRGFKPRKTVKELNFKYLRKRKTVKSDKNYNSTAMQNNIIDGSGY